MAGMTPAAVVALLVNVNRLGEELQIWCTDEFGFNVAEQPVHVHDLNATVLPFTTTLHPAVLAACALALVGAAVAWLRCRRRQRR